MSIHRRSARPCAGLAVTTVAALLAVPALAFEPTGNPVADALLRSLEAGGGTATYKSVTAEGDSLAIAEIELAVPGSTETVRFAEIVTQGAMVDGDRLTVPNIEISGTVISFPQDGGSEASVTIDRMTGTGIVVPDVDKAMYSCDYRLEGIAFRAPGLTLDLGDMHHVQQFGRSESQLAMTIDWEGVTVPGELLPPDGQSVLQALGYDGVTIRSSIRADYDADSGEISYDDFIIEAENVGRLTMSGAFGGMTLARMEALQKEFAELAKVPPAAPPAEGATPPAGPDGQPPAPAMAPPFTPEQAEAVKRLVSAMSLEGLSFTFTNESIVDRLLAMQAAQAGVPADVFAQQLAAAMPAMLMSIPDPAFREQVAAAAAASFLLSPGSITLALEPPAPVAFGTFFADPPPNPQTLPALFGARVTATPAQ